MTAILRRHSRTVTASSMAALFIRLLFIGAFVYAWFLIARTSSSENNAVLFSDDNYTYEKRVRGSHLEADKLIPFTNSVHLLHSNGLSPTAPPPTYPPFHEDKFIHEPPPESLADNREKPIITSFDDSPLHSAINGREFGMIKYEGKIKPILKESVGENAVEVLVPTESKFSNEYEHLVNTSNTSSDTYFWEQYSTTTGPGNGETGLSFTPATTVSVFSNFRDKFLNIIMPKPVEDQQNPTNTSTGNTAETENYDNVTGGSTGNTLTTSTETYRKGYVPVQAWNENDRQVNFKDDYKQESANNDSDGYTLHDKYEDRIDLSANTGKNLEKNILSNSKDNVNSQFSRNEDVRQNVKLRQQMNEKFHVEPAALEQQNTAETQISEGPVERTSSNNDLCPSGDIITVVGGGRLANCIWEYVSLWSLNKFLPGNRTAYAQKYVIDYLKTLFDNLNMPIVEDIPRNCACCKNVNWSASNIHMYSLIPLRDVRKRFEHVPGNIVLPKYIVLIEPVLATLKSIKKEIIYKSSLVQFAQNVIKSKTDEFLLKHDVLGSKITYVGVHVRRTDYKSYLKSKYNMTALGPEFYLKSMMYFRQRRPDLGRPIFLIVSDDILWVKQHLVQNDVFVVSRGNVQHPEQDLVLLSLCNHSIIDYGTYGLWAAVYAGGVTITVRTSMHVYQTLGRKLNWHFVSVNPGEEIEIY